jgi:hypothetical protein
MWVILDSKLKVREGPNKLYRLEVVRMLWVRRRLLQQRLLVATLLPYHLSWSMIKGSWIARPQSTKRLLLRAVSLHKRNKLLQNLWVCKRLKTRMPQSKHNHNHIEPSTTGPHQQRNSRYSFYSHFRHPRRKKLSAEANKSKLKDNSIANEAIMWIKLSITWLKRQKSLLQNHSQKQLKITNKNQRTHSFMKRFKSLMSLNIKHWVTRWLLQFLEAVSPCKSLLTRNLSTTLRSDQQLGRDLKTPMPRA